MFALVRRRSRRIWSGRREQNGLRDRRRTDCAAALGRPSPQGNFLWNLFDTANIRMRARVSDRAGYSIASAQTRGPAGWRMKLG